MEISVTPSAARREGEKDRDAAKRTREAAVNARSRLEVIIAP
jgi:hypothetical protein